MRYFTKNLILEIKIFKFFNTQMLQSDAFNCQLFNA